MSVSGFKQPMPGLALGYFGAGNALLSGRFNPLCGEFAWVAWNRQNVVEELNAAPIVERITNPPRLVPVNQASDQPGVRVLNAVIVDVFNAP